VAGETWVKVAAFARPFEAEAARIRLDAEGIPAILDGHRTNTAYAGQFATGGSRLLVPEVYVQDARILLSQSWDATEALADDAIAGEEDLEDLDDLEPAEEASGPSPALADPSTASLVFWVSLLILGPLILGLIQLL
jgi:hypothetical protein